MSERLVNARRLVPSHVLIAAMTAALLAVVYLRWTPLAPDLAAQVARADVIRHVGNSSWWTGWFGGISMPSYSVLVPSSMATLGVRATGVLATILGAVGSARLLRAALRPRAGACAFALTGIADLADGRVTFVVGAAVAVWALNALLMRHVVLATLLGIAAYFASPLAALFLGLVLVATAIIDASRRRDAVLGSAAVLVLAVAMALLFPGTGTMPYNFTSSIAPALCCLAVLLTCKQPAIRVAAALALGATLMFVLMPGAVGSNITRLAWIAAAPVTVAYASLPRKLLVPLVAVLAAWPISDTIGQLQSGRDPSAHATFYQPLAAALAERQASMPVGERLEVVDPINHWSSVYLTGQSLARGWDRQADNADNPIFYQRGALTAASYQKWLASLAVGWVALPATTLDFASVDEGKLVRSGLPYLSLAWSNANWRLYRVIDAAPLATGADVWSVTDSSVMIHTSGPGLVHLRLRWSPYLSAVDPMTKQSTLSCAINNGGWLDLYLPKAETVDVTSNFTVASRLRAADPDCQKDVAATQASS